MTNALISPALAATPIEDRRAAGMAWIEGIAAAKDGTYWATEFCDGGVPTHMHVVRCPGITSPGGYVQTRSMNAFRDRQVSQWGGPKAKEIVHWFSIEFHPSAVRVQIESGYEKMPLPHELPRTEYPDLWSFYDAIGWDYKNKRFTK